MINQILRFIHSNKSDERDRSPSRLIETDVKSMNSLQSGHSRRSSDTSQISVTSSNSFNEAAVAAAVAAGMSPADVNPEEDLWTTWGKLINEWEARVSKRQLPQVLNLIYNIHSLTY